MQLSEQLEQEFRPEPIGKPMAGAVVLHALLAGAVLGYAMLNGLFHHNAWGGATDGAIAVQLVSNALPLPADQKPNDNVLATEHPSDVPALPRPEAKQTVDQTAIAIPDKVTPPKKVADKKQQASKQPTPVPPAPSPSKVNPRQAPPKPDDRAQYGEQAAGAIPRSALPGTTNTLGQSTVTSGGRGFNYPWYVENINRKMQQNTNPFLGEVDSRTPKGAQSNILFTIRRDGTPSEIRMDRSSGSPTLDRVCLHGAQRVDTFGPLPSPPGDGPLIVSYHCDY